MGRLVIYRDRERLAEHDLARGVVGLGRHPENDIVLDDRTLSRFHARIVRQDVSDGVRWIVKDLGAQNGVHLNGSRISDEEELHPGDRIDLGCYTAVFEDPLGTVNAKNGRKPRLDNTKPIVKDDSLDVDLDDDLDDDLGLNAFKIDTNDQTNAGARDDRTADLEHNSGLADAFGDDLDLDGDLDGDLDEHSSHADYVPPKPAFVLLFNQMEVSRHPLTAAGLTIGRSKQCDIVISLLGLSRRHAQMSTTDEGVVVEDLGSQNGTWVNNQRIEGRHVLQHGDLLNFYDYGVLFLEDGDVEVGFPGAGFTPASTEHKLKGSDDLSARETDQALGAAPSPSPQPRPTPAPARPLVVEDDDDLGLGERAAALPEETELGRQRPGSVARRGDDRFDLDGFDGSFFGDEFDDGASKVRDAESVVDSGIAAKPRHTGGTDVIDALGLSRPADDEDIEAELAFSNADVDASFGVENTDGELADFGERTSAGFDASGVAGQGDAPSDDELDRVLAQANDTATVTIDITMKGKQFSQWTLAQQVMRVGTDPRCEYALPKASGMRPWHATFLKLGGAVMVVRAGRSGHIEVGNREVESSPLRNGDVVRFGDVEMKLRIRR